ncbi:phage tail protein [Planococcaceae bacterium Storch 2/2-2]|nr:phage tail protein [Planococcaceae bacterium Storch 2/2-2]
MRKYRTVQGDMWDSIAYKLYGSERYMVDLLRANQEHRKYYVFPANVMLDVPDVDTTEMIPAPPWEEAEDES